MRPLEDVRRVAAEFATGASAAEVARRTGIPWRTVRKWELAGLEQLLERRLQGVRSGDACIDCPLIERLDMSAYSYLLGQYLGDGTVVRFPRTWRLEIFSDARYPEMLDEIALAMGAVIPASKVARRGKPGCVVTSSYSNHWPCLLPQHGPGPKHTRLIELVDWQRSIVLAEPRPFLRGLVHSDGCRVLNVVNGTPYPRYHFTNRSDDIRNLFAWACGLVGVDCRPSNRWNLSVARRGSVELLDSFIGPKR